ncbi:MAG: DUF58 domain-containing protein [Candidatus Altiarchaeales archaeon]|nr:DUF58 domain-containing protein [Candidatus Altiarchaeales archaeon]
MIDSSFLDELEQFELLVKRRVSSLYAGERSSTKMGRGVEVVDFREYYPGDDFRLIDWKVYARTDKLYIKRFMEERDLTMHLLVDSSNSMDFGTKKITKYDYAGSLAAGFGFVGVENQEKFAFGLYSSHLKQVSPQGKDRLHLMRILDLLNNAQLSGKTNLGQSSAMYNRFVKTKSYFIVLSDFLEPLHQIREGVHRLSRQSIDLTLIQVLDPLEKNLGLEMDVKLEDLETSQQRKCFISPGFRQEYQGRLKQHISSVADICRDFNANFISVTTDQSLMNVFVELMGGWRRG